MSRDPSSAEPREGKELLLWAAEPYQAQTDSGQHAPVVATANTDPAPKSLYIPVSAAPPSTALVPMQHVLRHPTAELPIIVEPATVEIVALGIARLQKRNGWLARISLFAKTFQPPGSNEPAATATPHTTDLTSSLTAPVTDEQLPVLAETVGAMLRHHRQDDPTVSAEAIDKLFDSLYSRSPVVGSQTHPTHPDGLIAEALRQQGAADVLESPIEAYQSDPTSEGNVEPGYAFVTDPQAVAEEIAKLENWTNTCESEAAALAAQGSLDPTLTERIARLRRIARSYTADAMEIRQTGGFRAPESYANGEQIAKIKIGLGKL